MASMTMRTNIAVLVLALSVGAGCSLTTMETARQLESGEAVVGGGLDWPGILYIPRVSAYGKVGVADRADLGLQAGFTYALANVGATARFYPTDGLTMSLQGEVVFVNDGDLDVLFGAEATTRRMLVLTPRISTALNEGDLFYGGVQANVLSAWRTIPTQDTQETTEETTEFGLYSAPIGAFGGVEFELSPALTFQSELMFSPMMINEDGFSFLLGDGPPLAQLSVGVNYRFGGEPEPVRRMEPSKAPRPEEPVREQPTPEPEEEGVPIY